MINVVIPKDQAHNRLTDTPGAAAVAGRARSGLVGLIPARPQQQADRNLD